MPRFAEGASVSLSVALLFPGVGSVTPPGAVTVAVFDSVPVAAAEMVQLAVYVTLPPLGRLSVALMLPLPDSVQFPYTTLFRAHVQVSEAGKVSATVEPGALLGPALLAAIV